MSQPKIAIVLFNLGAPDSPAAVRPFLMNLFTDPAILRVPFFVRPLLARLLDVLSEATLEYLSAQIDAGVDAVMLFDSWAGVLSPALFRAHVIGPTARIVAALRARHPGVPVIGFPRLAGMLIGEYAVATQVQGVGLDTAADPALAATLVPTGVALQGNLDPLALVAGGAAMETEAREIVTALRGRPHIFNLGHGIVPETPIENVSRLVNAVRTA